MRYVKVTIEMGGHGYVGRSSASVTLDDCQPEQYFTGVDSAEALIIPLLNAADNKYFEHKNRIDKEEIDGDVKELMKGRNDG